MKRWNVRFLFSAGFGLAAAVHCPGGEFSSPVRVGNAREFREAVSRAKGGTRILLAPGEYAGGFYFSGLCGEKGKPIVIGAQDPNDPPLIKGGSTALHFSDPLHVELENLVVSGSRQNGINIDDGGSYGTPARWVVLRKVQIKDIGPRGNRDGLKLSGVDDFRVQECRFERWGIGGSGIDMVGCHRGVIEGCQFLHTDDALSTGVQTKGGSSEILVRRNRFENAGGRAVNIGGSTGFQYFRPPLERGAKTGATACEAKDIRVEGNTFLGGGAAVAFVGVDGADVRFNTIYRPKRWVLRILQETRDPDFIPSRSGKFTDNLIAFSRDELRQVVNIGPGTAPETFQFARNFWFCIGDAERSRPRLPAKENDGIYGKDPLFQDPGRGDLLLRPGSSARKMGAEALPE